MRPGRALPAAALAGLMACAASVSAAEGFDVSAYEKKAFEWNAFVELMPEHQWLRRGSTGYALMFAGQTSDALDRRSEAVEASGIWRHETLSFNFTGHANTADDAQGSSHDGRMYEAYAAWQFDPPSTAEVGKRALHWGKGYAWNPVAFFERPKDPTDPDMAREGFVMADATWVRSFDGPLKTLSATGLVVPTTSGLNPTFGPAGHLNPAVKIYALLFDTDLDLIVAGRGGRGPRLGLDFSRNLGNALEVHGEWASSTDMPQALLGAGNTLTMQARNYTSALLGLRYLTERDTTFIFELYRNGSGYAPAQIDPFYELVRASAANPALLQTAGRAAAQGYNRPNALKNYAYLRVSQNEPFDIVNFTPALSVIADTGDHSFSLIPEAVYTGINNLELRLRLMLNRGDSGTEFGEKPVRTRLEFRARCFF